MGKEQGMNTPYKDLISVIVPVYKVERYLAAAWIPLLRRHIPIFR